MKKFVFLFAFSTVTLAALCFLQSQKLAARNAEVASLKAESESQATQVETAHTGEKESRREAAELRRQADELGAQLQEKLRAEAAAVAQTNVSLAATSSLSGTFDAAAADLKKASSPEKGMGDFLSKMMQDPQTKKFIREQQRMMMDQLYAPLVKQMEMSPEEADQFKNKLAENMMKGAEKASSMFGGDASTNRAELMSSISEDQKNSEEELKALLGESRYALYKDYQLTVAERTQLNQFKLTGGLQTALTDDQTEQLLTIMKEEKQSVTSKGGQALADLSQKKGAMQGMLSDEQIDKMLEAQTEVNERVYNRANELLAPDQMQAFGKFQTNQLQMMRMGMSMARKMFGNDKSTPPASEANSAN